MDEWGGINNDKQQGHERTRVTLEVSDTKLQFSREGDCFEMQPERA